MSKDIALIFHPFFYDWEKYPIRGIDRYNYELLRNYKKMGIDPSLLDSGYVKNHIDGIVKEIVFPFKLIFNGKKLYHATHPMGAKWAILTRRRPLITTIHDLIPFVHQGQLSDWGLKYKMKSLSIIWAAKYSDHVIVPFKSSKDMLVNDYNIDPNKISIVNYGIDHQKYFPVESKKVKDHKTIFFVGELAFAKGVDTLIKATGELIRKDQNIELVLGSNGKDKDLLVQMVKALGIESKVRFVGRIPEKDLPMYYNQADLAVFPSRYGFGLASLEAMACGVPAIAGKTLDAVDFMDDDRMLVDPENPEELAQKMSNVLYNDSVKQELINNGLEKSKKYSWNIMAKDTLKIYSKFINI